MSCVVTTIPPIIASGTTPGTSASPGFQYGRAGDVTAGTYLQVIANVPSSTAGNIVPFEGTITRAFFTAENAATCTLKIQRRDVGPVFVDLATLTLAGSRRGDFALSVAVAEGAEIVVLLDTGTCRNVQVGVIIEQNP